MVPARSLRHQREMDSPSLPVLKTVSGRDDTLPCASPRADPEYRDATTGGIRDRRGRRKALGEGMHEHSGRRPVMSGTGRSVEFIGGPERRHRLGGTPDKFGPGSGGQLPGFPVPGPSVPIVEIPHWPPSKGPVPVPIAKGCQWQDRSGVGFTHRIATRSVRKPAWAEAPILHGRHPLPPAERRSRRWGLGAAAIRFHPLRASPYNTIS